ncbi:MAG: DUF6036 family nucleotidyltransferase [bacterium]
MNMMVPKDFEEFFELLNNHKAKYLIVGGYAFAIHARPRFTRDIDILLCTERENAERIILVLKDFGFGSLDITLDDLMNPNTVIQLGYPPLRIDLIIGISGIDFHETWDRKVTGKFGNQEVFYISKQDLITSKKIAGRKQDLLDIEELERL